MCVHLTKIIKYSSSITQNLKTCFISTQISVRFNQKMLEDQNFLDTRECIKEGVFGLLNYKLYSLWKYVRKCSSIFF